MSNQSTNRSTLSFRGVLIEAPGQMAKAGGPKYFHRYVSYLVYRFWNADTTIHEEDHSKSLLMGCLCLETRLYVVGSLLREATYPTSRLGGGKVNVKAHHIILNLR